MKSIYLISSTYLEFGLDVVLSNSVHIALRSEEWKLIRH